MQEQYNSRGNAYKSHLVYLASIVACAINLLTRVSNTCNSSCLAINLARYACLPMRAVNLFACSTVSRVGMRVSTYKSCAA